MRKRKEKIDVIIDGVRIADSTYRVKENRIITLLIKGFITYLICAGMIGCALTATNTELNHLVFNFACLLCSAIISCIYYSKLSENIGDIVYFLVAGYVGITFSDYINSGFYSWMNDLLGSAGAYFNIGEIGGYNARISDSYLTVTFASCYLGSIAVMLIYITLVKRIHFLDLILDCSIVLVLPSYLELEPNIIYYSMVLAGIIMAYVWNTCKISEKTNDNTAFRADNKGISYVYNYKAVLGTFLNLLITIALITVLLYVIFPKDDYIVGRTRSNGKNYTDDTVSNIMTAGLGAFFNRYDSTGGLSTGRLGGINSVSMDYQTDLYVTYAPYNYNAVYIRDFIAGDYTPYLDYWNMAKPDYIYDDEYNYLSRDFGNNQFIGQGRMVIENVDANNARYMPYYSLPAENQMRGESREVIYYTRLNGMAVDETMRPLTEEEYEYWTYVPEENKESVRRFTELLDISDDMSELEVAMAVKMYFEENVPYTLRPGATPRRKDFINYFLDNNKKGYCAHFASAGTMALRYLGIPARYVEGYCFDYENMLTASIVDDDYNRYYSGFSEIDDRGVIRVNITDADAHAWVEIFIDGYGWTYIELTPPSSDTNVSAGNLFSRLLQMLQTDSGENKNTESSNIRAINTKRVRIVLTYVVIIGFTTIMCLCIFVFVRYLVKYYLSDINDRLIIRYHRFLMKKKRKFPVEEAVNYQEQIAMLIPTAEDRDEMIRILEKAGFSKELITEEEFKYVTSRLK